MITILYIFAYHGHSLSLFRASSCDIVITFLCEKAGVIYLKGHLLGIGTHYNLIICVFLTADIRRRDLISRQMS